ncbi:MAG: SDR family oxidoreductase [Clostridiales Family XIII bacterium]|jgi:NAD(P)-dependent dehydrogenase (short-subunit alcohol dehydrogenase family)|nr:SDR family oxidoreductase [Clostridiales Family XIII bacterium]
MKRLEGKVAAVTGSSSGFGRAIAIGYAKEGAKIVCADIRKEPLEKEPCEPGVATDDHIRKLGGEAVYVPCDVRSVTQLKQMVGQAVESFGSLDIMVNNAGAFTAFGPLHELNEEDWDVTVDITAKGMFLGCQQAVRQFLKQGGGVIVNICSIGGVVGLLYETAYCAAKGATFNLTKAVAIDYADKNIRCNGICPNYSATPMSADAFRTPKFRDRVEAMTPMGRWMEISEIVGPAVFLASDESSFVTGHNLVVDGGYTIR